MNSFIFVFLSMCEHANWSVYPELLTFARFTITIEFVAILTATSYFIISYRTNLFTSSVVYLTQTCRTIVLFIQQLILQLLFLQLQLLLQLTTLVIPELRISRVPHHQNHFIQIASDCKYQLHKYVPERRSVQTLKQTEIQFSTQ